MIEHGVVPGGRVVSEYRQRVGGVSDGGLVTLMREKAARIARLYAEQVELIAELYGRPSMAAEESPSQAPGLSRVEMTRAEIKPALRLTWRQASDQVQAAIALDERMLATMLMLRTGAIDWGRVQVIARHAVGLGDHTFQRACTEGVAAPVAEERARAVVRRLEEAVLGEAPLLPPGRDGRLEQRLREAVAEIDPEYAETTRRVAVKHRSVTRPRSGHDDPDGCEMKDIWAHLPAPEAEAVWRTIDTYARYLRREEHGLPHERTLDQVRADVLTHLIVRGHPPMTTPAGAPIDWGTVPGFGAYGLRANVDVTVSIETLMGISDAPGHLAGHGPVTAQVARDLAFKAGSRWRRLVTDPLGRLLDYGRDRYKPPDPLTQFIRARDRYCRTPGCDRPAGTCDVDHIVPYPEGPTAAGNLQSKCRRDHRLKHEGRWRHQYIEQDQRPGQTSLEVKPGADPTLPTPARLNWPAGTIRLVSPTGQEYYSHPIKLRLPPRLRPHPLIEAAAKSTFPTGDPPF